MSTFPYLARTTLKYKSPHATDLSFAKDETIRVTGPSDDDEDWLVGETLDGFKSGGFPKDFIIKIDDDSVTTDSSEAALNPSPSNTSTTIVPATIDPPPMPEDAPAPPSPKPEPAKLPPSTTASPAPTSPAIKSQTEDAPEPAKQSMKERLAFFAAAQNRVAPPPPVKPKPAAGGLTWSQRQKLRQEQEAKEAENSGGAAAASTPVSAVVSPAVAASVPAAAADVSAGDGLKADAGLSAADAQSSIGKGGSLKERMAALRGAGAFGAPEAKVAPSPPAKPSGKVWSRPAALDPVPGDEEEETEPGEAATGENNNEATEGGEDEVEQTEEEQEKARRAAIAARMAKLGTRGPMGMPPTAPPKPTRKPTMEAVSTSPIEEKTEPRPTPLAKSASSPVVEKGETDISTDNAKSPPTSVAMPAIPRRTAGPRRAARPAAAKAEPDASSSVETVGPDGTISPPPPVMVANEENPPPKSAQHLEAEKQHEEAGKGPAGLQGAQAAGIALAPPAGASGREGDEDEAETEFNQVPQAPQMVPLHDPAPSGPPTDVESDGEDARAPHQASSPSHAILGLPKDEIEMKHQHDAAAAERVEQDEDEDEAPPPPPRMTLPDRPTGPRPLPIRPEENAGVYTSDPPALTRAATPPAFENEDEDDIREDFDSPPRPPARQTSMALPPRPSVAPISDAEDEDEEEEAPPPPVRGPTIPPPSVPAVSEEEDEEAEDPPLPPPRRETEILPPLQMPPRNMSSGPRSPNLATSTSQPLALPMLATSPTETTIPLGSEGNDDDEDAVRRQGIAARMAKLGGVKFGVPPPVPKVKRTATSDNIEPSSPGLSQVQPPTPTTFSESLVSPVKTQMTSSVGEASTDYTNDSDETPEQESERRRKTLARLRAGGTLGYGMFGQGHGGPQPVDDQRGLEEAVEEEVAEEEEEEEVKSSPPMAIQPPMPTSRPPPPVPAEEEPEDDDVPPPPPSIRPTVPANRPMPPVPDAVDDEEAEGDAPPLPPPARPIRTSTSDSLRTPTRTASTRDIASPGQTSSGQAELGSSTVDEEPSEMVPPSPIRPSPLQMPSQNQTPIAQQSAASPTARRSLSIASRQSFQSIRGPTSPTVTRSDSMQAPLSAIDGGRPSFTGNRPGFNDLQAASQDAGQRVLRAAQGLKKGNTGDGSPAGFVMVVYEHAKLPPPVQSWGQVVYEQESGSVLKKYDEARPGDIAAFYDARLKGKKGLSSYNQQAGSVEDPLVGVIVESEQKKHKLRVLQVERGILDEVSYRCDDLKSGRIVVFRPGM